MFEFEFQSALDAIIKIEMINFFHCRLRSIMNLFIKCYITWFINCFPSFVTHSESLWVRWITYHVTFICFWLKLIQRVSLIQNITGTPKYLEESNHWLFSFKQLIRSSTMFIINNWPILGETCSVHFFSPKWRFQTSTNMVLAASIKVLFLLSTTPFCLVEQKRFVKFPFHYKSQSLYSF